MGARMEEYQDDAVIISEGDTKNRMYIVLEGDVILYNNYKSSDEYIIGVVKKGASFGEISLLTGNPYPYTAIAYGPVKVAWFEKNNLTSFINGYPDYAMQLFENTSKTFLLLTQNLKLAIEEINTLRRANEELSGNKKTDSPELSYDEIMDELAKSLKGTGKWHTDINHR